MNGMTTELRWLKSSLSFSNGNCVEVAAQPGSILVRDSQNPDGPVLQLTPRAYLDMLASIRDEHRRIS